MALLVARDRLPRSSGVPGPGAYWLRAALAAPRTAPAITAGGPSSSGKPWPRLTDPVRIASADISVKIVRRDALEPVRPRMRPTLATHGRQ